MGQDADSSNRNWRGFAKTALPFALLAACLLSLDPLRVEEGTAAIARTFIMRVASALYPAFPERAPPPGEPGKPGEPPPPAVYAHDAVTVVLIDEAYLKGRNVSWPLSYRRQAVLIDRIASYAPEAIFVDILYSDEHDRSMAGTGRGDVPRDLTDSLAHSGARHIVFAAVADDPAPESDCAPSVEREPDSMWRRLQHHKHLLMRNDKPAPRQRSLAFDPDRKFSLAYVNWSHCEERYPLYFARDARYTSPALALYRLYLEQPRPAGTGHDAKLPQPGTHSGEPFVPRWGALPPAGQARLYKEGVCQFDDDTDLLDSANHPRAWLLRARVFLQQLALSTMPAKSIGRVRESQGMNAALPCPALNVVYASTLAARDSGDPDLVPLLKDKLVLFGTDLKTTGDVTVSPVHGEMAGVLLHATALDNLIRAPQSALLQLTRPLPSWLDDLLPYVVLLVLAIAVYFLESRLESAITLLGGLLIVPALTVLLVNNLGWLGKVTTQLGTSQLTVVIALIAIMAALSVALWLKGWLAQAASLLLAAAFIPRLGGSGLLPLFFGAIAVPLLFIIDPKILFRATCSFGLVLLLGVSLLLAGFEPFNVLTIGIAAIVVAERIHLANDPCANELEHHDRVRRLQFAQRTLRTLWIRRPGRHRQAAASAPIPSPPTIASPEPTTSPGSIAS